MLGLGGNQSYRAGGLNMGRSLIKTKGRREAGSYVTLPHAVLEHENFVRLHPRAVKLLLDLYAQYRGHNNGDLCAAFTVMKERGWKSKSQLQKAKEELLAKGWLVVARQGGRNKSTLYAVTFQAIDECGGKLDIGPTNTPPGNWKQLVSENKTCAPDTVQVGPHGGAMSTKSVNTLT